MGEGGLTREITARSSKGEGFYEPKVNFGRGTNQMIGINWNLRLKPRKTRKGRCIK